MDRLSIWPHLGELCDLARETSTLEVWLFGSALKRSEPGDIDVLFIYTDRADVTAVREARWWHHEQPPLSIIAMTEDEDCEYGFRARTNAQRLV